MGSKEPHGQPRIWLTAVIAIYLAPVTDPIVADIAMTIPVAWAMVPSYH